jgi:hypothetical protein
MTLVRKTFQIGDKVVLGSDMTGIMSSAISFVQSQEAHSRSVEQATKEVYTVVELGTTHDEGCDPRNKWLPPAQRVRLDPVLWANGRSWILADWLELASK